MTLFEKVDVTSLFDLIENESAAFEAREGVPLEASAVFAAALSRTAEAFPAIAPAASSGTALVNLAVDTALGTIYPAVVASRREGIAGLLRRVSDLRSRAEAGSLTPQELSLGDITLITGRGAGNDFIDPCCDAASGRDARGAPGRGNRGLEEQHVGAPPGGGRRAFLRQPHGGAGNGVRRAALLPFTH